MLHSAVVADIPTLVEALLRPGLLAQAVSDPQSAAARTHDLASSSQAFARGALPVALHDLVSRVGCGGAWVWAVGDARPDAFATLAVGRPDAEGACPVAYDLAEADEEHPGPWRWDLLRLLSSIALLNPEQKGSVFSHLVGRTLDGYGEALDAGGEGVLAADQLPQAVQDLQRRDAGHELAQRHVALQVVGEGEDARLRVDQEASRDLSARAFFLPALASLYGEPQHVAGLDCVRLPDDPAWPARRRWRALVRERGSTRQGRLRLLEIRERPPSCLARLLQGVPVPPVAGAASSASLVLGHDPLQRLFHGPVRTYSVRSSCHTRRRVDPGQLGSSDLERLARAWGFLLANAHLRGLKILRVDLAALARDIGQELGEARQDMARLAWEHAAVMERGYAAFRKLSKQWRA